MRPVITGYEVLSCLGDAETTFSALLDGTVGVSPLRPDRGDAHRLGVSNAYHVDREAGPLQTSAWLSEVIGAALARSGLDPARERTAVIVGTGMRETASVERWHAQGTDLRLDDLHFAKAVRRVVPAATEVLTLSNACSAAGSALALACDLLAADEADAVVVAGCDGMARSMLAAVGRGGAATTPAVRPFDADRRGILLGEGAAALVLQPPGTGGHPLATVRGVGLSCDAHHETAPSQAGIAAAMRDAHERASVTPHHVDLVVTHGTGTALNDPTEAGALEDLFGAALRNTLVTGVKAGLGHTSGSAFLMSLVVAIQSLREGVVPPIAGLRTPIEEASALRLVRGAPAPTTGSTAQVEAFGFGGVNAVAVLEVTR